MGKEHRPTTVPINKKNSQLTMAFVDEKATVITVCHQCGILYFAIERNFVTTTVAENTAQDHGNYFSLGHHVSVVSGESPTFFEETLTVNEDPKLKTMPSSKKHFFIP